MVTDKSTIGIMYSRVLTLIGMDPSPIRFLIRTLIYLPISISYKALQNSIRYLQMVSYGKGLLMVYAPNIIHQNTLRLSTHVQNQTRIYICILLQLEMLPMSGLEHFLWAIIFREKVYRNLVLRVPMYTSPAPIYLLPLTLGRIVQSNHQYRVGSLNSLKHGILH